MKMILSLLLLCSSLLLAQDQAPTGGRPATGRIQSPTRAVTKYKGMESELFDALKNNSRADLDKVLDSDFETWTAERLSPMPRAEWMDTYLGNLKSYQIRNMAVREFGDIAVVSFLLERKGTMAGKPMSSAVFIVDVWRQGTGKLAVRYSSSPSAPAATNRPTGKE